MVAQLAGRVSGSKRFQQPGALSAGSLAEQAIPAREGVAQLASPGLQLAQASLESEQLLRGKGSHAATRRTTPVAFAEDGDEFIDREADR